MNIWTDDGDTKVAELSTLFVNKLIHRSCVIMPSKQYVPMRHWNVEKNDDEISCWRYTDNGGQKYLIIND
jgi:hypothetical protein